jgi:ABC-type multidrug transport system ATPase subunit
LRTSLWQNGDQRLLKGHSGAGKTTLIHMMAGILTPSGGTISINSIAMNELSQSGSRLLPSEEHWHDFSAKPVYSLCKYAGKTFS